MSIPSRFETLFTQEQREAIFEYLKENLSLDTKTESNYVGGMDDSGQMYRDSTTVLLLLEDEVISSVGI